MPRESHHPTAALVLEMNNLRSGPVEQSIASLERLLHHLQAQTRPLTSLAELVITHDGLPAESLARLKQAAGRPVRFVELQGEDGYYTAKNRGFEATRADVVAFGDADCWPEPRWLEALLAPFESEAGTLVAAGRTTYREDLLGAAATTIDFMYFDSPLGEGCTRNFYANNVAFRREVFARHAYLSEQHIYRGHCQVLGLRLQAAGVPVRFVPEARTVHRFPDSLRDFARLRLLRGADAHELTPHLARAYLPPRLQWLGDMRPAASMAVLAARLGMSLRALNHQDLPPVKGMRRAACVGAIVGLSLVDAAGALAGATGLGRPQVRDGALAEEGLGYHTNRDGLTDAAQATA
ncbi:MAG: glycosyltransferase [Hyalangium sp.]|uniref:glycosyltransferase n=1 Tax=Hyalangium sp. TaxID=2028555 RepID=UPI00389A8FD0